MRALVLVLVAVMGCGSSVGSGTCEADGGGSCPAGEFCAPIPGTIGGGFSCRTALGGAASCFSGSQCASGDCRDGGFFGGACAPVDGGETVGSECWYGSDCQSLNCGDAGYYSSTTGNMADPSTDGGFYVKACAPDAG
jgi:hypothetical protein